MAIVLCATSLLLFMATAVLWIRGWRGGDTIVLNHLRTREGKWVSGTWQLQTWGSGLELNHTEWELPRQWNADRPQMSSPLKFGWTARGPSTMPAVASNAPWWERMGLIYRSGSSASYTAWFVRSPFWLMLTLGATSPSIMLFRHWQSRRRRARQGLCKRCGYDLRATPDRCPECGTVPYKTVPR
jgi:hypothetical protein